MNSLINIGYAGLMPDELPRCLKNDQITSGIECFCKKGSHSMRITTSGGLTEMSFFSKIAFSILNFLGISTQSRTKNVQYQFLKLLYLASSRKLILKKTEVALLNAEQRENLLGISEAIENCQDSASLKDSLYKFSVNHQLKPSLPFRVFSPCHSQKFYKSWNDFGITHLQHAKANSIFETLAKREERIKDAISCISLSSNPSENFCIEFVELLKDNPRIFTKTILTKDEPKIVDTIFKTAVIALEKRMRYSEAATVLSQLRERLLGQKKLSEEEENQLAYLESKYTK